MSNLTYDKTFQFKFKVCIVSLWWTVRYAERAAAISNPAQRGNIFGGTFCYYGRCGRSGWVIFFRRPNNTQQDSEGDEGTENGILFHLFFDLNV